MDFQILNSVKSKFREIHSFYLNWNNDPESIIHYLISHPTVKKISDEINNRRQEIILLNSSTTISKPKPYKISGKDLIRYLYFDKIVKLQHEEYQIFFDEILSINTDVEVKSRLDWCRDFYNTLTSLSTQLELLENPIFSKEEEYDDTVDWTDIKIALKDLSENHLPRLIKIYEEAVVNFIVDIVPQNNMSSHQRIHLHIRPESRNSIVDELSKYIDVQLESDKLSKLINNNEFPETPIILTCKQVDIIRFFRSKVTDNKRHTDSTIEDTVKWICQNFVRLDKGQAKKLSYSTVRRGLFDRGLDKD